MCPPRYKVSPRHVSFIKLAPRTVRDPLRFGVGGMSEVYRAKDTKLHREVAIIVAPDSFAIRFGSPHRAKPGNAPGLLHVSVFDNKRSHWPSEGSMVCSLRDRREDTWGDSPRVLALRVLDITPHKSRSADYSRFEALTRHFAVTQNDAAIRSSWSAELSIVCFRRRGRVRSARSLPHA